MLQAFAPDIWHVPHAFKTASFTLSTRMTVVRLSDGRLWLHSPVPIDEALAAELAALGPVAYLVAPNKAHHLFLAEAAERYPEAEVWLAPGLAHKRPALKRSDAVKELGVVAELAWRQDIDQVAVQGMPALNEVVFFHRRSSSLIITDLCQCWTGKLPKRVALLAWLTGVRRQLGVPRSVKLMVRDRKAFHYSVRKILQWPFTRVLLAHDCVFDQGAHGRVAAALRCFD